MGSNATDQFDRESAERFTICATAGGRILYVTGELIYYIGQNPTGRNLNDLIPDDLAADVISSARRGERYTFECTVDKCRFSCASTRADQEIQITMFPVNDPREVYINKNAAELIVGEMNDSLHMMRLFLNHMAKHMGEKNGESVRMMGILNQQIYRLTRLSRNLSDSAMWVNGALRLHFAPHDIAQVCRELVAELQPLMDAAQITFTAEIPQGPVTCHMDREKVQRMILNLIANSMKALEDRREVELALTAQKNGVAITVVDYGRGSDMEEIFSKITQVEPGEITGWKGAGFGISLVRAYAKSHGGAFVMTSKQGGRTVARITLPYGLDRSVTGVNTLMPQYGGGHSLVLTELATALDVTHYTI